MISWSSTDVCRRYLFIYLFLFCFSRALKGQCRWVSRVINLLPRSHVCVLAWPWKIWAWDYRLIQYARPARPGACFKLLIVLNRNKHRNTLLVTYRDRFIATLKKIKKGNKRDKKKKVKKGLPLFLEVPTEGISEQKRYFICYVHQQKFSVIDLWG